MRLAHRTGCGGPGIGWFGFACLATCAACAESGGTSDVVDAEAEVRDDGAADGDIAPEAEDASEVVEDETGVEDVTEESGPPDRDGDTVPDSEDAFPDDPDESVDTDGDTIGNNADTDDDGDTLADLEELDYGVDCRRSNPLRPDTDGDTIPDPADPYPQDPWPEFVINENETGSFYAFLSRRDGTFEDRVEWGDDIGDNYTAFTIADFDDDGAMDFIGHSVTPDASGNRNLYFFYRTERAGGLRQILVGPTSQTIYGTVADVNNDHLMDIVTFEMTRPPGLYITQVIGHTFLNNGSIRTAGCPWQDAPSETCAFTRVLAYDLTSIMAGQWVVIQAYQAIDVTGDGFKDLVIGNYASGGNEPVPVRVMQGRGDGTFATGAVILTHNADTTQSPANSMMFADFTGDGIGDVIAGLDDDGDPGQAWIYPGLGPGTFSPTGTPTFDINRTTESGSDEPGATGSARCFDFDFDGNMDVMVGYRTSMADPYPGVFEVWLGFGTGQFDVPIPVGPALDHDLAQRFAIPTALCPWYGP